jgi:hypothetical protein
MFRDIGHAFLRKAGYAVRAPFDAWRDHDAHKVRLAVAFKLTDKEYVPIPGERVRLFLGRGDPLAPGAGTTVVTDKDGAAEFEGDVVMDRRWFSVNVGFTPFSAPFRMDHLAVAAELDCLVPWTDGEKHTPILSLMDIWRDKGGDCRTYGFSRTFVADADGRLTQPLDPRRAEIALPDGGVLYFGEPYRPSDYMLTPDSYDRWTLKLSFARTRKRESTGSP